MLRMIGFAVVPLILSGLPYVGILPWVWTLVCLYVAVQEVCDLNGPRTFLVVGVGIIFSFTGWTLLGVLAGLIATALG